MPDTKKIELTPEQVDALKQRIDTHTLQEEDYKVLSGMIDTLLFLRQAAEEKTISIKRLLNLLFGPSTEKAEKILGPRKGGKKKKGGKKPKGHGRKGASAYPGADKVCVPHPDLRPKDPCPACEQGKVYKSVKPGSLLRFLASVPVKATVYEMDKLRCNLCGEIFSAPAPEEAGPDKYDETVAAMIAVLKYGSGLPFYRIEKLQESFGIPLAASTQWEQVKRQAEDGAQAAYEEMIRQAAQGEIIHNDDTTMKVLALMNLEDLQEQEEEEKKESRTGVFTSGLLSVKQDRKIALFFTGNKHAGENLEELLKHRDATRDPPIQMCDALSRNLPKSFQTVLSNCLCHARRNFVDVSANFPQECEYIIETMGKVYKNEEIVLEQGMSPAQRLSYHQSHSRPVMEELKKWLDEQIEKKKVEPNSGLGKAIAYMNRHWEPLTLFLSVENAPLHNNICERALKKAILHRKNSLFYKTEYGAYIGDLYMSLIHTCNLVGANPFEYLVALALHKDAVNNSPQFWMPWNYTAAVPQAEP